MPIYEFKCPICEREREVIVPTSENSDYPKSRCVFCSKDGNIVYMKRVMSAPALLKVK